MGWVVADEAVSNRIRTYRDYTMICGGVFNDDLATYVLEHKDKILERNRKIVFGNRDIAQAWTIRSIAFPDGPAGVSTSFIQLIFPRMTRSSAGACCPRGECWSPVAVLSFLRRTPGLHCASEDVLREGLRLLGEALAEFDARIPMIFEGLIQIDEDNRKRTRFLGKRVRFSIPRSQVVTNGAVKRAGIRWALY